MLSSTMFLLPFVALASLVAAHFQIDYPPWRSNSFNAPYSQYIYPCAGVPSMDNRTLWPLTSQLIEVDLHHPWTYFTINLGIGNNISSFNVSLTPNIVNSTGNGTLCYPVSLPVTVTEGMNASIQIVTFGQSGSALYNCADIQFSAKALSGTGNCTTNGVTVQTIYQEVNGTVVGVGNATTSSAAASSSTAKSGAVRSLGSMDPRVGIASAVGLCLAGLFWL